MDLALRREVPAAQEDSEPTDVHEGKTIAESDAAISALMVTLGKLEVGYAERKDGSRCSRTPDFGSRRSAERRLEGFQGCGATFARAEAMAKRPRLLTIGAYGWSARDFFAAIERGKVELLVDLRRRRAVRGNELAWANSQRLQQQLSARGIGYVHRLDLAPTQVILSAQHAVDKAAGLRFRDRQALSAKYVESYAAQMLEPLDVGEFRASFGKARVVVLFCVEGRPQACHRSLVAQHLHGVLGLTVRHLVPPRT